jgi:hypothetical protein
MSQSPTPRRSLSSASPARGNVVAVLANQPNDEKVEWPRTRSVRIQPGNCRPDAYRKSSFDVSETIHDPSRSTCTALAEVCGTAPGLRFAKACKGQRRGRYFFAMLTVAANGMSNPVIFRSNLPFG